MSGVTMNPRFRLVVGPTLHLCEFFNLVTGESIPALGFKVEGNGMVGGCPGDVDSVVVSITFPPGYVEVAGRPDVKDGKAVKP